MMSIPRSERQMNNDPVGTGQPFAGSIVEFESCPPVAMSVVTELLLGRRLLFPNPITSE